MNRQWSAQEEMWLINNAANFTPIDLTRNFNRAFEGEPRSWDSIRKKIKRLRLMASTAEVAANRLPDASEWKELCSSKYTYKAPKKPKGKPKKKGYKTYLIWPDTHVPYQDKAAVSCVLQLMDKVKFDGLVILGDFLDMASLSHWNQNKRLTAEGLRLKEEYAAGNALLDEICARLPKGADMRWLDGNHEDWYYQYVERHPELQGLMDPHDELRLKERGFSEIRRYAGEEWKSLDFDTYKQLVHQQFTQLGKLWILHGIYTGKNHASQHIEKIKRNVMYGHLHDIQVFSSHSIARETSFMSYCIGCLADVSPTYMKGQPNNWSHAVGIVHVYPNGDFQADVVRIIHGTMIYNGHQFNGNEK